jgi:hypothetical protein
MLDFRGAKLKGNFGFFKEEWINILSLHPFRKTVGSGLGRKKRNRNRKYKLVFFYLNRLI